MARHSLEVGGDTFQHGRSEVSKRCSSATEHWQHISDGERDSQLYTHFHSIFVFHRVRVFYRFYLYETRLTHDAADIAVMIIPVSPGDFVVRKPRFKHFQR